jgi:hypothetical protein
MTQSSNQNYSELCTYGCGKQIYWNTTKKSYYEVETGNKYFCQSRKSNQSNNSNITQTTNRPTYYNAGTGKPIGQPNMSNGELGQTKQQIKHSNSPDIEGYRRAGTEAIRSLVGYCHRSMR